MKNLKKIVAVMLSLIMVAGFTTTTISAYSTELDKKAVLDTATEPNNYFTTAYELKENENILGKISGEDRTDIYKITLKKRSKVTLYHRGTDADLPEINIKYTIYNQNFKRFKISYYYKATYYMGCVDDLGEWKNADNTRWHTDSRIDAFVLNEGTYYLVLDGDYLDVDGQYRIMYNTSDPEPVFKYAYLPQFNVHSINTYAGNKEIFRVIDGNPVKWEVENDKIVKIDLVDDKVRIFGLQEGSSDVIATLDNGEKIKLKVYVKSSPRLTLPGKTKTIKSVTVKKGKTVTVRIKGKQDKIKNIYTNSKHAKIISKRNAYNIQIKGKKVGTSYVKIKVNGVKTLKLKVKVKAK